MSHAAEILNTPWANMVLTALVNLPFGCWRAGSRKWSWQWFLAIHLPVLLMVGTRLALRIPFRPALLPGYVLAFIAGQYLGAQLRRFQGAASRD
jgi:hypothetical protein